jgi:BASS family bile acid:Na+ symporter
MLIRVLAAGYLATMMFSLGLQLGVDAGASNESKESKKAKRRLLARGLLFNLVVLPLVAAAITHALGARGELSTALLLLAAAPGGRFSPQLVAVGGGDLGMSVEVTLFLAKMTAFTGPVAARWLLQVHALSIRDWPFLVQLVLLQLVPYFAGRWLHRKHAPAAASLLGWARGAALAAGAAAFVAVLFKARSLVALLDVQGWTVVAVVAAVSSALGWLAGGSDAGARRTLSIHANARQVALALAMASVVYPDGYAHAALFGVWLALSFVSLAVAASLGAWQRRPHVRPGPRRAERGVSGDVPLRSRRNDGVTRA